MPSITKGFKFGLYYLLAILFVFSCKSKDKILTSRVEIKSPRILVFMKTKGYHHESIPFGAAAIIKLGEQNKFAVDTTADASVFTDEGLSKYNAVVFLEHYNECSEC